MRTLFLCMVLKEFSETTKNKSILVTTIFFTVINITFFNLLFDLISMIAKEVNQIKSNVVCVVARLVFVFCCAITTGCCNAFQHNLVN